MKYSKKVRLLIVGSSQGFYGGIEAFMIAIAQAASGWPELEVCLGFKMVKGTKPKLELNKMADKSCKNIRYLKRCSIDLFKLIDWADVIHVQNMPPDIVIPAFLKQKKIFLTVHNRKINGFGLHNLIWSITIKLAKERWFNSKYVWNTWEPSRKGIRSKCIPTICNLPTNEFPIEKRKGFVFVGRWIKNKGIEEILMAYARANFDKIENPLTIIGDGPLRNEVIKLIAELDIKVSLPGFVSDSEKYHIIASSKWLLAPANTKEDLGLTPIEARNVGVPSIVSMDGGLPESGGPSALLVKPGDIEDLKNCLQIAASMDKIKYKEISFLAKESLNEFLIDINFYKESFLNKA